MEEFKLLLDEPINSIARDKFGHEHYANILYSLITNKNFDINYNIGLLGNWGVGKSSIKEFCQEKLKEKDNNKLLLNNIYSIDFNAWKYGSEGIKRALLKYLYVNLGGEYETFLDKLSRNIEKESKTILEIKDILNDVRKLINHKLSLILIIGFIVLSIISIALIFNPSLAWLLAIVNTGIITLISIYLGLFKNISIFENLKKIDLPKTTAEEFEELLINQIKKFKNPNIIPDTNIKEKNRIKKLIDDIGINLKDELKIVIFVDDLDRLPSKEMVEGINAIRTFMDLELPEGINIVFILSCCENKIADALQTINFEYEKNGNKNTKENIDKKIEAKRFLDKIFQFRIDIPPFPHRDMIAYTKTLINEQFSNLETELYNQQVDIETLLCRLIHPKVQNPRQAIQITNAFLQSWYIATTREKVEENTVGGLTKGSVTKYPIPLAVLSVLKVDYPYFYQELLEEPKFLKYSFDILNMGKSSESISQKLITEYTEFVEKDSKLCFKSKYQDLEWYLNSINQLVDFPNTLKPLLLLNQDPLTRKFDNDDATSLEEALCSKDSKTIISLFNLGPNRAMSYDQAMLLNSIITGDLPNAYKMAAQLTIIGLIDYINKDNNSNFILDNIVTAICNDKKLSSTINLEHYEKILNKANEKFQESLITNVLKKHYFSFNYSVLADEEDEKLQNYNYNQAKITANILLNFYLNNTNKQSSESLNWLLEPIGVVVNEEGQETQSRNFDFNFINKCFADFEFLINFIGKEYFARVLNELNLEQKTAINDKKVDETIDINKQIEDNVDITAILSNIEKYLNSIIDFDQNELTTSVKKLLEFRYIGTFDFIINYITSNFEKLETNNRKIILMLLSNAITVEMTEEDESIYEETAIESVVNFIIEKIKTENIINDEIPIEIIDFIDELHKQDKYINEAIDLCNLIKEKNISQDLLDKSFIEYDLYNSRDNYHENVSREYLINRFLELNSENQALLTEGLKKLIILDAPQVEDEIKNILENSLNKIPIDAFENENIISFFEEIFRYFIDNISSDTQAIYNEYYTKIFPIILKYFKYSKSQLLSEMLYKLCLNNTYGIGTGITFNHMQNEWAQLYITIWTNNDYAQKIFDLGINCTNPRDEAKMFFSIEKLLKSLKSLQNESNLKLLFAKAYRLWINNEEQLADIIVSYKNNYFTDEQIYTLGLNATTGKEESIIQVWSHLVKMLPHENRKSILKTIYMHNLDKFVIFANILKQNNDINIVIEIIIELIKEDINLVIKNKDNITNNIFINGEHRKKLALKLLDLLLIIPNDSFAYWAKNLYNDIMDFVKIRKFENNQDALDIINKVFYPNDLNTGSEEIK